MKNENKKNNNIPIPEGWKMRKMGEVAILFKLVWKPGNQDFKYIGLEHINQGDLTINGYGFSSKLESNKFYFKRNDVLFGKLRPYFRKVWKAKFDGVCSTDIWVIRSKEGNSQDFIFYFFANPEFINKSTVGSIGTKMPRADWSYLLNIEYNFPSFPEQHAIAAVLSFLDDKIELLREQNKTLEAIAQAIYKRWFVDFEFPIEDETSKLPSLKGGEPEGRGGFDNTLQLKGYKSSGGKMVKSELGEIPEGWEVGKIKDLIDILPGFAFSSADFSKEGQYKLVTIKNVQDRYFNPQTKDNLRKLPKKMPDYCILESGDILISLTGNVGRICLANGKDYLLNQRVAKLRAKNENDHAFTYLLFLQDSIFSLIQNTASGTAQQNLSPIQLKEINIIIADRKILDKFGIVANKLIKKIKNNISQIQTLSALRDSLLPKLMSGKIRVPVKNEAETTPSAEGCHPSLTGGELKSENSKTEGE